MDEKRSKGLCFFCDDKYTFGHNCRGKRPQLFHLEVEEEEYDGEGELEENDAVVEMPNEVTEFAQISGNAISGVTDYKTIRIVGHVGTRKVHMLMDTGSSHNFIDYALANSKGKKVMNALSFYKMETDEISERYIAPCFVNGLEAYDGEINLEFDKNLISNEFAVKLCLDYEVKKRKKLVKKELIVALKGELYFVKFIINPEEDNVEPGVILGRSFLRLAKGVVDFGNGVITIYPDLFEDDSEKTGKSSDDWDQLLDFNFDHVPKFGEKLPPLVCKMGKSSRNKKRVMDNLSLFYQDIGPSSPAGRHLTQEEATKEALAIRIGQKFALLEEVWPVIETMAYHDKYKKVLDEIWKDKVELVGWS
ncbi:hypothetical protein Tco_0567627 [Tanacetum coccineum]